mmetsp:Transcript_68662/g.194759  ORF Transcript_68662/g.194759 Transcript_68662/m.194759 type:complete len:490 (+) Transcript_68662:25-1494(+)
MHGDGIDPATAVAIIVNACMGMGFLSLPYTSVRVGPVVAIFVTLALGAVALLTALWTAIAMSLTAALGRPGGDPEVIAWAPLAHDPEPGRPNKDPFNLDTLVFAAYTEMVRALFGDCAWRLASWALCVALLVVMWAYAALVAGTLSAMVPVPYVGGPCDIYDEEDSGCQRVYQAYLLVFGLVGVALSSYSFKEQRHFQIVMSAARLLLVLSIIGDCARMHVMGEAPPPPGGDSVGHAPGRSAVQSYNPTAFPSLPSPTAFKPVALPNHVAVAMAALTVHMIIPEALKDLDDKPRNMLPTVGCALALCIVVYVLVSASVAFTFGDWTKPVCTLNWVHYTAGRPAAGWGAVLFRSWLLIVPTVDVTGAYPVLATALASTMRPCFPSTDGSWQLRVACALLPVVGAAVVSDLPYLLGCVGLCMLLFVFILPPIMILRAESLCLRHFGAQALYSSTYWRWHCDRRITSSLLALGILVTLAATPSVLGFEKMLF